MGLGCSAEDLIWYDWMHTCAGLSKDLWKCLQSLRMGEGAERWEREVNGGRLQARVWEASETDRARVLEALDQLSK